MDATTQFIHERLDTLREEKKALEAKIEAFECVLLELENKKIDTLKIHVRISSKVTTNLTKYRQSSDTQHLIDDLESLSIERNSDMKDIEDRIEHQIKQYPYDYLYLYVQDYYLNYNTYYLEIYSDGNAYITLEFN